jgi:hypothetical protein
MCHHFPDLRRHDRSSILQKPHLEARLQRPQKRTAVYAKEGIVIVTRNPCYIDLVLGIDDESPEFGIHLKRFGVMRYY